MCFQPRLHSHLIMLSNYISSNCIQLFIILSYKRILLGIDRYLCLTYIDVGQTQFKFTHSQKSLNQKGAAIKFVVAPKYLSFNRNIQTIKVQDTQGEGKSCYKFCRKSRFNLRKEILFQFVRKSSLGHCGSVPGDRLTALLVEQEEY